MRSLASNVACGLIALGYFAIVSIVVSAVALAGLFVFGRVGSLLATLGPIGLVVAVVLVIGLGRHSEPRQRSPRHDVPQRGNAVRMEQT